MKDSSDIRKFNMLKIKKILRQGGEYTKQQIANITGTQRRDLQYAAQ